ncbi:major facilitator superfamily domain-containing protein [Immersiella caudata]|uniref:Major facilitator superfamily domain-containing protein n=1 Tax=Immersiella caudata TaxID=314043 RepID=A0AA39WT23_9PEZI|nr:major facilitator superfamily domain-containing protein [Immersiella caudata]
MPRRPVGSPGVEYQPLAVDDTDGKDGPTNRPPPETPIANTGNDDEEDAQEYGNQRVTLTEADSKRIRQKTDQVILVILVWVYLLQILDKTILGYSAIFGLREDTNLTGNQYSWVGSIAPIAQLLWQPFSSVLIVKVPHRILMPVLVFGWGLAQTLTPTCQTFRGLLANRFFLGIFEAGCLPLFSIITGQWYRRAEQPVRVAAWYGTNGLATIIAALLAYGLGSVHHGALKTWQVLFLTTGLLTLATAPLIYLYLPTSPSTAPFLTPHERLQATERLRANQSGPVSSSATLKLHQIRETFLDPKTYLFAAMSLANNLGAQVTNTFGPLILSGFGYNQLTTTLLNIPFGAIQYAVILAVAYTSFKLRHKSLPLLGILVPILSGLVILYVSPREGHTGQLLTGYYLLAFIFGGNTLIVSWILANTAGQTKKSVMMSVYNAASSAGNIIGPLLFNSNDAPAYLPGLCATLGVFIGMVVCVILCVLEVKRLNWEKWKARVEAGGQRVIRDWSMEERYEDIGEGNEGEVGRRAFEDLTDRENEEFVYVY